MMKAFLFSLSLSFGMPLVAFAETLLVRSGEHETFSRLVTPLSGAKSWTIVQTDKQVVLTITDHEDGFNTDRVFNLIPRDRIARITTDQNSLTLSLACDCIVASFIEEGPFLVLDVAAQGTVLAGRPVPVESSIAKLQDETPSRIRSPQDSENALASSAVVPSRVDGSPDLPQPSLARGQLRADERQVLSEMQARLAQELGSAATRGVLTPAPGRPLPALPNLRVSALPALPVQSALVEPQLGPLNNFRISSSLDRSTNRTNDVAGFPGLSCPPRGTLDVNAWGTSDPFAAQIAAARNGLYRERDRLDQATAKRLAQTYIYFGFGAEARQILRLEPELKNANGPLLAMAAILDGQKPENPNALHHDIGCDPEVALWTMLNLPEPVQGAKPDTDIALLALSKLPFHLRQILAPKLSKKLLAFGDAQSAAQALRSLERTSNPLQAAAKLAQAELNLHNGQSQSGTAQLEQVAVENAEQSPAALIALIDAKVAANQPIDLQTESLIAAYAQELRETELGPDLRRAHILALLKSGQFDRAFFANRALDGGENTIAAKNLRAQLLRELVAKADDILFLEHIFTQPAADIANLPTRDLTALTVRFLAMGFVDQAENALSLLPQDNITDKQKLLAAQIALALGKPNRAQASVLGIESDQATNLRADAKRMIGAHDEAHDLYIRSEQTQPAVETAWLSEDWQDLTTKQTPVFGPASSLASYPNEISSDPVGMLARTTAALEESEAARQTLSDLLGAEALQLEFGD
jgi:hypothetical protein